MFQYKVNKACYIKEKNPPLNGTNFPVQREYKTKTIDLFVKIKNIGIGPVGQYNDHDFVFRRLFRELVHIRDFRK